MLGSKTLYIKHLPRELSKEDRRELMKIVGAVSVRVMEDEGKLKYSAFARFQNHEDAKHALFLLHQREMFGRKLVVEFANMQYENLLDSFSCEVPQFEETVKKKVSTKSSEKEVLRFDMEEFSRNLHSVAPTLGLNYLPSPLLKYKYPPPTPTIIQNISNALASVPKFYTQVLHLMNKMNLPAPFGPLTPIPPLAPDAPLNADIQLNISCDLNREKKISSEEESEYESDEEEDSSKLSEKVLPEKPPVEIKKKKIQKLIALPLQTQSNKRQRVEPSEVFDSQPLNQKKICMKKIDQIVTTASTSFAEPTGSFGEIEPPKISDDTEDMKKESVEEVWEDSNFITLEELRKKRMSSREMKTMSVFRNFSPGEPSCRLYIKNLAKQVDEKDLRYIFGSFINRTSETDKNMFDIKLMKEGRMKGQAFVSLANEDQAREAVSETNGFMLHNKPLVVQFARSAKPKEDKKVTKT